MKTLIAFCLSTLVAHSALAGETFEGRTKTAFPSQISVVTEDGSPVTYGYQPLNDRGVTTSVVTVQENGNIAISGDAVSRCLGRLLGTLGSEIDFDAVANQGGEVRSYSIPAGAKVFSSCPESETVANDLYFSAAK